MATHETSCCGGATHWSDYENEVRTRYAAGADQVEPELCCAVGDYEKQFLEILPEEILAKDYGCGDPSKWVRKGDTVVDLGSGAGKACYIMAQKVGSGGRVIGVDFNNAMLELARKYQDELAGKMGWANTQFVKAKIQDLALDLDAAQAWLQAHPVASVEALDAYRAECDRLRAEAPLIPSGSVDVVVSNCVLNLVRPEDKTQLFDEIFRVLCPGGRAVISDIVCDEPPTEKIMNDPKLWSGCISGAFLEHEFLERFEDAGFHGIEILARTEKPWRRIDGIEFRSLTVRAWKGKQGECLERNQAVIYRGPWRAVQDDDGHVFQRGRRSAVCDKTFGLMTHPEGPYAGQFEPVEPRRPIALEDAKPMDCTREFRDPSETKRGLEPGHDAEPSECTGPGCC